MKQYDKIVAHIPHSSIQDYSYGWMGSVWMFKHVKRLTDWHTDLLFVSNNPNVETLVFPHSRFYLDVERLDDDPLESIGQGKIYTKYEGFKRCRLTSDDVEMLNRCYQEWKRRCAESVVENTLVVDCHSFPHDVSSDIDVCIGFNDDGTRPEDEVVEYIVNQFKIFGYRVGINNPYTNSIVFCEGHDSIMIEINKSVYMDESTLEMQPWSYRIHNAIMRMYDNLLKV